MCDHPDSPSRLRRLVCDACACLHQQMFFRDCNARHREGNLLVRHGLTSLPLLGWVVGYEEWITAQTRPG